MVGARKTGGWGGEGSDLREEKRRLEDLREGI